MYLKYSKYFIDFHILLKYFFFSVHIKIQIPELVHKHNHQQTVYKETPTTRYEITYSDPNTGKNERIVVHSHDFSPENGYAEKKKHLYNPEKKHTPKQKKATKKKYKKHTNKNYGDDTDFKKILNNYDSKPENGDDGGFKTSVQTEHYEVKKINPNARYPDEKYIIEGAYKVQETDPWGKPVTSLHKYDSPLSKIEASILSKYDYTNFRPGESDSFNRDKDEERDHEKNEYGLDDDSNSDDYGDYNNKKKSQESQDYSYDIPNSKRDENEYEKSSGYEVYVNKDSHYTAPQHDYGPVKPNHQNPQGYNNRQVYITFKPDDSKRVENSQNMPAEVEHVTPGDQDSVHRELEYEFQKEFGHLVQPGHTEGSSDSHYDYDNDWQKHLIDYLYGGNHAASNKFVQKVNPEDRKEV